MWESVWAGHWAVWLAAHWVVRSETMLVAWKVARMADCLAVLMGLLPAVQSVGKWGTSQAVQTAERTAGMKAVRKVS